MDLIPWIHIHCQISNSLKINHNTTSSHLRQDKTGISNTQPSAFQDGKFPACTGSALRYVCAGNAFVSINPISWRQAYN